MRLRTSLCIAGVAAVIVGAYTAQKVMRGAEPWGDLQPVTAFSYASGTSPGPTFAHRPTADELYSRLIRLYDSFQSAACTGDMESVRYIGERREPGPGRAPVTEWRMKRPDMDLEVISIDGRVVAGDLQTGRKHWSIQRSRNDRVSLVRCPPLQETDSKHSSAVHWLGLGGSPDYSHSLDPDERVGDTDCYVLVIRPKQARSRAKASSVTIVRSTNRLYIGKRDLLPRQLKMEDPYDNRKPPERIVLTIKFRGFIANPPLPSKLFLPPPGTEGAR